MKSVYPVMLFGSALVGLEPRDPLFFSQRVYPILERANCRGCHTSEGVASPTRLQFPSENALTGQVESFGKTLGVLVDRSAPGSSLLLKKPTNRISHGGGERIKAGSEEESVLIAWATYLAGLHPGAAKDAPTAALAGAAPTLRRLTHSQYNRTVRDLLGDQTEPARQFPGEDFVDGFRNQAQAQSLSPLLAESYLAAAEKIARRTFRFGDQRGLIPCKPASPADSECASKFVRQFGLRAFRRPLTKEEVTAFSAMLVAEAKRTRQFVAGAQIVTEAMLQSPNFLFRIERGTSGEFEQYEIASRLSYALWDTMPNQELLQSAAAGKLATAGQVEKQARRMLTEVRAREALDEFVSQWMRFDRLLTSVKDRRLYVEFVPTLPEAMAEETRRLVHHLVWGDRSFLEFLSADYSFLNADLASLYQVPPPLVPFSLVKFPQGSERAGILGHGSFLAQTGKPEDTSPTERGLFVREHFLCQNVPPPPLGVNTTLPPFLVGSKPLTNRERLTKLHLSDPSCAGCHNLVDPIGFGLERFDTIGRWAAKQQLTIFPTKDLRRTVKPQQFELDVDTTASIRGIPNSDFASARELGRILSQDPTCQKCIVRQWFRFAFGRRETDADRPDVDRIFEDFRRSGFRFQEMMISAVKSNVFREAGPYRTSELRAGRSK